MNQINRRKFIKLLGAAGVASTTSGLILPGGAIAGSKARVVVVGGGFGGATCACYLRRYDSSLDVTLIEPNNQFITCPFSNTVLAGIKSLDFITHNYDGLHKNYGVKIIHDTVISIDATAKNLKLKNGKTLKYDKLVVSPGISFNWDEIEGASEENSKIMPHAWKAGTQTTLLRKQLEAMKDGGKVIIAAPRKPFRAPPAPYERASLIAYYLKKTKPSSKILFVDSSGDSEELAMFRKGWEKLYKGMIEWVDGSEQGEIISADAKTLSLTGRTVGNLKGDIVNLIPPQRAGDIARVAGLTDKSGWCPVSQQNFASRLQKDIHVIGDACIADPMQKTGHSANTQGKICAAAIVTELSGGTMPDVTYNVSIYSLLNPKYALSSAGVYRLKNGKLKQVAGGLSAKKASRKTRLKEARFASGWYKGITMDTFGKT
ncbi:MAG TPA: twin-arginine translocation signal domain-containing protein [Gammaproteobacteria bacterium]|nr:twin-arginine translocation signal domain-containing protein [Gammaproteobacteria bacterium]